MILKNKYIHLISIFVILSLILVLLNSVVIDSQERALVDNFKSKIEIIENSNINIDDLYYENNIIKLVYKNKIIIEKPSNYYIDFYYDNGYSSEEINYYLNYFLFDKKVDGDLEVMYIQILNSKIDNYSFSYVSTVSFLIIYFIIVLTYYLVNKSKQRFISNISNFANTENEVDLLNELEYNTSFKKLATKFLSLSADCIIILDEQKNIVFNNELASIFISKKEFVKYISNFYLNEVVNRCFNEEIINEETIIDKNHYQVSTIKTEVIKKKYYAIYLTNITDKINFKNNQESFFNQASHELRTPLSILQGSLEYLNSGYVDEDERVEMYDSTIDECRKLNVLISSIIDISKRFKIDDLYSRVSLDKVLNKALEKHKYSNIKLNIESSKKYNLICNEYKLYTIFENLVKNAFIHNVENGFVNISINEQYGLMVLIIENSSKDLSDVEVAQVFNPFYKCASNYDDSITGAGLGLTLTKIICENYNYDIEFTNENSISKVLVKFYSNNLERLL